MKVSTENLHLSVHESTLSLKSYLSTKSTRYLQYLWYTQHSTHHGLAHELDLDGGHGFGFLERLHLPEHGGEVAGVGGGEGEVHGLQHGPAPRAAAAPAAAPVTAHAVPAAEARSAPARLHAELTE